MIESLVPLGIVTLIFGGCCSNVFALEAIVKEEPNSGLLITLGQFILVCLAVLPSQLDPSSPYALKRSAVPFHKWLVSAGMFFAVNMLNNWAFAFNISVPVHIILRSFGSATTMAAGHLTGKRYSRLQILSVALLTAGVLVSAWADASGKGKSMTDPGQSSFGAGLAVLLLAQLLSAWMGVYVQDLYAVHGAAWEQNLFYSHLLSLPMFVPLRATLGAQFRALMRSPPLVTPTSVYLPASLPLPVVKLLAQTPRAVFMLGVNSVTQLLCISGVNLLSAKTSAVTVTIVLNIRKLVSFIFSIWLFGNRMGLQMAVGAVLVFGSGALYGWETTVGIKRRRAKAEMEAKKAR
ncbi:UAA transporter [Pseudovirgaria hyperparasitica]|uniref:UAA transporter n=1 Tax=Pseudovirgaria hyperparasitica TaxID=470096 RepID=A0A6A6W422_9PEZI|nr:UAA transporter [Pseudovirgaria hyperparasitica]KAF2756774.1 UAA transporter [Pseudovirgaria hyperparasitica]